MANYNGVKNNAPIWLNKILSDLFATLIILNLNQGNKFCERGFTRTINETSVLLILMQKDEHE